MKEYKIAKVWAVITCITGLMMICVFGFLLIMPLIPKLKNEVDPRVYWLLALFSIVMISIIVMALFDVIKGKFVIDRNKVFIISAFSNRELLFHEIKGYRITEKFIFIEAKNTENRKIKISSYFDKTNEIKAWLSSNYIDLDAAQKKEEKNEILNNPEFGWNKEERAEKLSKSSKIAKIINWTGALIGGWSIFFPNPYQYAVAASMLFPVICFIVLKFHNGLIKIGERRNTNYPTIFLGFFTPVMAIFFRALLDFTILDYSNAWMPILLIASICIAILLFRNREFKFSKTTEFLTAFGLLLCVLSHTYGSYITLNCILDTSEPEVFKTAILNKRKTTGKTNTYYLQLAPWGQQIDSDEIKVSRAFYNSHEQNDEVQIYLMKGKFEVPWFEVIDENVTK